MSFYVRVFWTGRTLVTVLNIFTSRLKQHIRLLIFNVVLFCALWPWSIFSGIWNLLFATSLQCGHIVHVALNTICFLYGAVLNKFALFDLISSDKTSACLIIHIEGYFSYSVWMMTCIVYVPLWLILWLSMMSNLLHSFLLKLSFYDMIKPGFMYIYKI